MDRATAEYELRQMVAYDSEPTLTAEDITRLLDHARVPDMAGSVPAADPDHASPWTPSTAVLPGHVVLVGQRYWRATIGGTTGSDAPIWTDLDGFVRTETVSLDGTVTWKDAGSEWGPTWDLNAAAAKGWEWKAAKAAALFSFGTDGQQFSRGQIHAHCVEMAGMFRRRRASSIKVSSDAQ